MSADLLRRAAEAERVEWGSAEAQRTYPTSSAIHLALAAWLDDVACWWEAAGEDAVDYDDNPLTLDQSTDAHAVTVARLILGEVTP